MYIKHNFDSLPDGLKLLFDGLSFSILLGTLVDMLPAIASLLAIVWWSISIYEKPTVQRWLGRDRPEPLRDLTDAAD